MGLQVGPQAKIEIDPKARGQQREQVTILLHKPIGYVSGQAEDGYEPAVVLVQGRNRWTGDTAPQRFRALAAEGTGRRPAGWTSIPPACWCSRRTAAWPGS
jgi:23S rRNA pseudouridine2604 synthase